MKKNRDIDFLFEIGCIRFISRFWKRFLNADFQNLAEHHFRVAWIALILAKHEKVKNIEKVLMMALVHDIAESRTGDTDYISRQYVQQFKELAVNDITEDISLEKELRSLIEEYDKRESIESHIVKDADNLDVDMELKEQEAKGNPIRKEWLEQRKILSQTKLYTKAAKELWNEMETTNPHNWHTSGRNRFSKGGDLSVASTNSKAFVVPTVALQKADFIPKDKKELITYTLLQSLSPLNRLYRLAKEEGQYLERFGPKGVEKNKKVNQLVMYGYFMDAYGKLLIYKRTSGTERRLSGKTSIGIGGHIDISNDTLMNALYKEFDEEAKITVKNEVINFRDEKGNLQINKMKKYIEIIPTAVLKDNRTPVGTYHLAIVCEIVPILPDLCVNLRSEGKVKEQYVTLKEYRALVKSKTIDPEPWTEVVFKKKIAS